MKSELIFLDHASATPLDDRVLEAMKPYFADKFYNPSSAYYPAVEARQDYEEARGKIAKILRVKPDDIIFTAGATEAINLAIRGMSGHVLALSIEHQAVLSCLHDRDFSLIPVDKYGQTNLAEIEKAIKPETTLIAVAMANNELGTIQPISKISQIIAAERKKRLNESNLTPIYLLCDASGVAGQVDVNPIRLGVDLLVLNAGKMYGPKQVGLLYKSSKVDLDPICLGGGQERGLRGGTENVPGVVGFSKALELVEKIRPNEITRLSKLRDYLKNSLSDAFPEMLINSHPRKCLSSHLHISFPGIDSERLVFALEEKGVLVSTGSACSANYHGQSHVLKAIGLSDEAISGSLRLSLGHLSNEDNIKKASDIIIETVKDEYKRVAK